jgi:hypothetical protein
VSAVSASASWLTRARSPVSARHLSKKKITKMAQEKHNNNFNVELIQYAQKNIFSDYFVNLSEYGAKSNLSIEKMIPTSVKYSKRPLYLWE